MPGRTKLIVQTAIGLAAGIWIMSLTRAPLGTGVSLPFFKEVLIPLGDSVHILPGHMRPTTIGHERQTNPFFQQG